MASLFYHKLTVLPAIDKRYVLKYEKLVRYFLWQEKKTKIALEKLYNAKELGGLSLVNISRKDAALKIQWLNKIKKIPKIANLANSFLPPKIWSVYLVRKDIQALHISSPFWKDVVTIWMQYRFDKWQGNLPQSEIASLPLFLNSCVKVRNQLVSQNQCQQIGIYYIRDLLSNRDPTQLLNADEIVIESCGDAIKCLKINQIISALKPVWNSARNNTRTNTINKMTNFHFDTLPTKVTGILYKEMVNQELSHVKLAQNWSEKLKLQLTTQQFDEAFANIYKITTNVKLRDFQFRLLHRRIFTNKILYKWKIVESNRCFFCRDHYKTIEHLFFDSEITKRFWTRIWTWYEAMTDTEIMLDNQYLLLNVYYDKVSILDTLVLIAKQYIFRCKSIEQDLNFYNYKDEVLLTCKIERRYAFDTGRYKPFQKKWGLFLK